MNNNYRIRLRLTGLGALTATAVVLAAGTAVYAAPESQILGTANPNAIAGSYIVVFKDTVTKTDQIGVSALTDRLASRYDVKVEHTYHHALQGFAGTMSRAAAKRLAGEPDVAYVEQNGTVQALDIQLNPPSWGLDRIDQRYPPLDNSYTYATTAANVRVYIIDTGIRVTHTTFGGRAVWGTNTIGDGVNTDCNGHGTHVAGIVGGTQYGVAKGVALTAVKVLDCFRSGSFASITAGIDWVTGDHPAGVPAVANVSIGSPGTDTAMENAVRNSIADGIVYSISSGNDGIDACNSTPARVAEAITVNASARNDLRLVSSDASSNFGPCTDIFAPGGDIVSSYHTSDTATATLSGTSMAAPHVAGAAALILAANPNLTPAEVATSMLTIATPDRVTDPGEGSPNRLLFVGPPTASLGRYYSSVAREHISSTSHPGGTYVLEGILGRVENRPVAGTHPIYQCLFGSDFFTSLLSNCEGRGIIGLIGFVYTSPPSAPNHSFRRCMVRGSLEHFDSFAANCEGHINEGVLGYLLN